MRPAASGIEKGAVSHAPAETTLNRQRRIGDVAICAATAAAKPEKRKAGLAGRTLRIGCVKPAMPETAANVSTVPTL